MLVQNTVLPTLIIIELNFLALIQVNSWIEKDYLHLAIFAIFAIMSLQVLRGLNVTFLREGSIQYFSSIEANENILRSVYLLSQWIVNLTKYKILNCPLQYDNTCSFFVLFLNNGCLFVREPQNKLRVRMYPLRIQPPSKCIQIFTQWLSREIFTNQAVLLMPFE